MSRVKNGKSGKKHKKYILKRAKGYLTGGSTKLRQARERLFRAEDNAYKSRRKRKSEFRSLWIMRINGALRTMDSDLNYSKFMNLLKKSGSTLNRKSLAEIAFNDMDAFKEIVESVKKPA